MSTIEVANYANEDGSKSVGADYVIDGSAKAWVNFNGTGTIAARDSLNVSSLTDNGTGSYTASLTSNMGNVNYLLSGSAAGGTTGMLYSRNVTSDRQTGSVKSAVLYANDLSGSGATTDADNVDLAVHGDLA